jgi:transcriptional regulator with XRE-family HTH domain
MPAILRFSLKHRNIPTRILTYGKLQSMTEQTVYIAAIRRLMRARGWNQNELAAQAGVRPNTITDALNPHHEPRITTLILIARAFRVPLWALCCTEEEYTSFIDQAIRVRAKTLLPEVVDEVMQRLEQRLADADTPPPTGKRKRAR